MNFLLLFPIVFTSVLTAQDAPRTQVKFRVIDDSQVGKAQPDSSATADLDGDDEPEVITAMRHYPKTKYATVYLYDRTGNGEWEKHTIETLDIKGEVEWVAVGQPYPHDNRFCIAAAVQDQKNGLRVLRLGKQNQSPFDGSNWIERTANDTAGQGLRFHDLDGDQTEELIYASQHMNDLGVLSFDPLADNDWRDYVIDQGNDRSWWWLNGKYYDLNGNGYQNDFFVTTRNNGGNDLGIWTVVQSDPNDLSSYKINKIYERNALWFDTGYFFSRNRDRTPDVVMVNLTEKVHLLDGRNEFEATRIPLKGTGWNVKAWPALGPDHTRDSFVMAATDSPSLFWTFRWNNGAYEVRGETRYKGDYAHPFDATFTVADLDRDGTVESVAPDSTPIEGEGQGLGYLDLVPATKQYRERKPVKRVKLNK